MENILILAKNLILSGKRFKVFLTYLLFSAQIISIILIIVSLGSIMLKADKANAAFGLDSNIKQVKTLDNPKVYYLDHARKMKKAYVNEVSYLAYGNRWSDIKIISQAELDKWPEINLVKTSTSHNVYFISNGQKSQIKSEQDFISFGFKWQDIVTIKQNDLDTYALADYQKVGLIYNMSNNSEQIMLIKLDSLSPKAGEYLALNTKDNLLAIYDFESLGEETLIKGITFYLTGIFKSGIVENIYLADENGVKIGYEGSIEGRKVTFNLNQYPIIFSAGQKMKIKVLVDLADCQDCINHTIGISINQLSDVNTTARLTNTFPVASNQLKLINASGVIGQLKIEEKSLDSISSSAIIGTTEQVLSKFVISETTNKEDVKINEIILVNKGSAVNPAIVNFKLKNDKNSLISQVQAMSNDNTISFKISNYTIAKNSQEIWTVLADINGGENSTINLNISQVKGIGKEYGYSLPVTITNLDRNLTISRELLGVTAKDLTANTTVFAKQTGVIIGNFQIKNNNSRINLKGVEISLTKNTSAPNLDKTIYLVNYYTGEVYSSINGSSLANNAIIFINIAGVSLEPKKDITLALITEIPSAAKNGDRYQIYLNKVGYFAENNMYYSDSVTVAGINLIVSRSNLYIYPDRNLANIGYTKGQKGIKIASFIIEASAGDDVVIDNITFALGNQTSGSLTYDNGFSNMKAYIGGRSAANTINQPYGPTYNFTGFKYQLSANTREEVKVYVDTENDLDVSETQLAIISLMANGYKSSIPTTVYNLNTNSYSVSFGEVTVTLDALSGGTVNIGELNNLVASFQVENIGDEKVRLNYITITTSSEGLSNSLGYTYLEIIERASGRTVGSIYRPVAGANRFSLGSFNIDAGNKAIFDVQVDASLNVPASSFNIYFSELDAEGYISLIDATIYGDPTEAVEVIVN